MGESIRCPMEANRGMQPSRARWEFRLLDEHVPAHGGDPIAGAQGRNAHYLAMLEHQAVVAASCLRTGYGRKALEVLRRAYTIAQGHSAPPEPVCRLGMALVHLQLCVSLSQLGRHDQALHEARLAKFDTDEIWRTLTDAVGALEEADAMGDFSRPAPLLRKMIREPPPWLHKVIEASVQSRQAAAMELEFLLAHSQQGRASLLGLGGAAGAEAAEPAHDAAPSETLPTAEAMSQEIEELHRDAARMARELLPEGHEVRDRAGRNQELASTRREELRKTFTGDVPKKSALLRRASSLPISPMSTQALSSSRPRPEPLELPEISGVLRMGAEGKLGSKKWQDVGLAPMSPVSAASTTWPGGTGDPGSPSLWSTAWSNAPSNFASMTLEDKVPTMRSAAGHPTAPRGDVRVYSFLRGSSSSPALAGSRPGSPASPPATAGGRGSPAGAGGGRRAPASPPAAAAMSPSDTQKSSRRGQVLFGVEQNEPDRSVDPFSDWKNTVVDVGHMSLLQLSLRTLDGVEKAKRDIELENRRFQSLDMGTKPAEELAECRALYSPSALAMRRQNAKRDAAWKQRSWGQTDRALERTSEVQSAFEHYGVAPLRKATTAKHLRKAFEAVQVQSPLHHDREWQKEHKRLEKEAKAEELRLAEESRNAASALRPWHGNANWPPPTRAAA